MTEESKPASASRIEDYALIGDCHGLALVSRRGSIDWCCVPQTDSGSCFGRILDSDLGGYFEVAPEGEFETSRRYLQDTLVLETTFEHEGGTFKLTDCLVRPVMQRRPRILRVIHGLEGTVPVRATISPRFEYGSLKPWIQSHPDGRYSAIGGDTALVISGSIEFEQDGRHDLVAHLQIEEGSTHDVQIAYVPPELIEDDPPDDIDATAASSLETTITWWRDWSDTGTDGSRSEAHRSALVLKALTFEPTGAFVAAPTTSLPEEIGGERNWDYRYSWVRDSAFAARALIELGYDTEARSFRKFVERSAAGSADELQPMYGVDGRIRIPELELEFLSGHRGSRPVRIGNAAYPQLQLDLYGYLLDLAWRWHERGWEPQPAYWGFLVDMVEAACEHWAQPDRGIWEIRDDPQHFVHSKVMCWSAVDYGLRLAERMGADVPASRWADTRAAIAHAIEERGFDSDRGVFVRSFDSGELDASLLLLPWVGFTEFDDDRMVATAQAVRETLGHRGLIRRYTADDGLGGEEGVFIPCAFWLAECLARQGDVDGAREVFDRAASTCNDLGLFPEEFDPVEEEMLGNFPQAMSHFSHIMALRALEER